MSTLQANHEYMDVFTDEWAREKAASRGCTVVYASDNELQLDIDSDEDFTYFLANLRLFENVIRNIGDFTQAPRFPFKFDAFRMTRSANGNRHIVLPIQTDNGKPLPMAVRILLQAVLGSDRRREMLSFMGMIQGQENPILFFEKVDQQPEKFEDFPDALDAEDDDLPF